MGSISLKTGLVIQRFKSENILLRFSFLKLNGERNYYIHLSAFFLIHL